MKAPLMKRYIHLNFFNKRYKANLSRKWFIIFMKFCFYKCLLGELESPTVVQMNASIHVDRCYYGIFVSENTFSANRRIWYYQSSLIYTKLPFSHLTFITAQIKLCFRKYPDILLCQVTYFRLAVCCLFCWYKTPQYLHCGTH